MKKNKKIDDATFYKFLGHLREHCVGKENGCRRTTLANLLGVHERTVRYATKRANEDLGLEMLISTSHSVYVCNTKEECEQAIRNTYRLAISLLKKAKAMEKKVGLNGQIKINLDDDIIRTFQVFDTKVAE